MTMSVVRKPQFQPQTPSPYPNMNTVQPQPQMVNIQQSPTTNMNIDLNNVRWIEIGSNVKKINPGERVIFRPLTEVREIKNGSAWIVLAYVYEWRDANGQVVLRNTITNIYMQKVLASRVRDMVTQYGVNNVIIDATNLGKRNGRYYDFQIRVGVIENATPGNA